jgi:catechol 2,3-dioxygenase-like lactoylglutathione lyase family enzyme
MTAVHDTLDALDDSLHRIVRDRLALCARTGADTGTPRIEAVHARARAFAAAHGLDPGFLRRLYDVILDESGRLETAAGGGAPCRSALARTARAIDHVAIAVRDLESAIATFRDRYGFELVERRRVTGEASGMDSATMRAGGVTFVLCQGDSPRSQVSRFIEHYGPGVQHIALEVSDQPALLDDLAGRGAALLTTVIRGPGLDQSFTRREANTGVQMEFITRTGNDGFADDNVRELFAAMEREEVF